MIGKLSYFLHDQNALEKALLISAAARYGAETFCQRKSCQSEAQLDS